MRDWTAMDETRANKTSTIPAFDLTKPQGVGTADDVDLGHPLDVLGNSSCVRRALKSRPLRVGCAASTKASPKIAAARRGRAPRGRREASNMCQRSVIDRSGRPRCPLVAHAAWHRRRRAARTRCRPPLLGIAAAAPLPNSFRSAQARPGRKYLRRNPQSRTAAAHTAKKPGLPGRVARAGGEIRASKVIRRGRLGAPTERGLHRPFPRSPCFERSTPTGGCYRPARSALERARGLPRRVTAPASKYLNAHYYRGICRRVTRCVQVQADWPHRAFSHSAVIAASLHR